MPTIPIRTSLIIDSPEVFLPREQVTKLDVPVSLLSGNVLTDWASFLLTIREDPQYGTRTLRSYESADPTEEGWESTVSVAGSIVAGATPIVRFVFVAPAKSGIRRYALDAWGIGGIPGNVPLVESTWVSVGARTR